MTAKDGEPSEAARPKGARARAQSALRWLLTRRGLIAVAAIALAGLVGAAGGYLLAKSNIPHTVRAELIDPAILRVQAWFGVEQRYSWRRRTSHLGAFEIMRVPVFTPEAVHMAAIEELENTLLFLTRDGDFTYMTPSNELLGLDLQLPMNTEALRAANLGVDMELFRALDLLAVEQAPHVYDLYASYDRFDAERTCFQIVVSRLRIAVEEDVPAPQSDWHDLFATRDCVPPRVTEGVFIGIQSGGRLVRLDERTLLLSVGDLEFDGVNYRGMQDAYDAPQDPNSDLGKIISIDLASGRSQRFAAGLRNPQGLTVDSRGRIWETEHGPFNGDEINLIRRGGNYGWPIVTYGMSYSPQGSPWPLNPTNGRHTGYDLPAYVFVPSLGISQLVQPSQEEFPFWDDVLLVSSLRARSLYLAVLDGDRIMYAEPLQIGERLRDIINRRNGQIAIISDEGALYLLRAPADDQTPIVIADNRSPAAPAAAQSANPSAAGQRVFAANCQSCHSLAGQGRVGPPLNGVVGRDIASADFNYSTALENARGRWTQERLMRLLTDDQTPYPGTTMAPPHLTRQEARNVISYLRTTE